MSLLEDASESNQILITTHNPELLRHAKLDWLLLVERTRDGSSVVKRPADSERVRIFMEEQLGLDYLHVNQMLGV
jgi:predicted ATPase